MTTDAANPASAAKADVPHEVVVTCPATGKVVGPVPVATSVEVPHYNHHDAAASK
jgi:hypothetical protein